MRSPRSPCSKTVSPAASSTSCGPIELGDETGHELDDLIRERDHSVVVRGHDDDTTGTGEPAHDPEHGLDLDVVEVRGGLVGEDQRWVEAERPRDGDALLLPAGQVTGVVMRALRQADLLEQLGSAGAGFLRRHARRRHGCHHVLGRRRGWARG